MRVTGLSSIRSSANAPPAPPPSASSYARKQISLHVSRHSGGASPAPTSSCATCSSP